MYLVGNFGSTYKSFSIKVVLLIIIYYRKNRQLLSDNSKSNTIDQNLGCCSFLTNNQSRITSTLLAVPSELVVLYWQYSIVPHLIIKF